MDIQFLQNHKLLLSFCMKKKLRIGYIYLKITNQKLAELHLTSF